MTYCILIKQPPRLQLPSWSEYDTQNLLQQMCGAGWPRYCNRMYTGNVRNARCRTRQIQRVHGGRHILTLYALPSVYLFFKNSLQHGYAPAWIEARSSLWSLMVPSWRTPYMMCAYISCRYRSFWMYYLTTYLSKKNLCSASLLSSHQWIYKTL